MTDPLANEIGALAHRVETSGEKLRRALRRLSFRLGMQDHYRRVFCDQTGRMTESGVAVLRDLAVQADFGRFDARASEADLRTRDGARKMLLHIIGRIDLGNTELAELAARMRENTNARS